MEYENINLNFSLYIFFSIFLNDDGSEISLHDEIHILSILVKDMLLVG